ncbi:myrosinase 1-like [Euwallacea similis]|uniref:myrosinase 1-like n=1 Tax=Euwallacea similis TaxID=1736056 RepID=UPI00344C44FD
MSGQRLVTFLFFTAFFNETIESIRPRSCAPKDCDLTTFPENFKFGTASSAYQIEGGWNEDGKGKSWWDWYLNTYIRDNGNVASDSYHRYLDDIEALKEIGVDYYRFSISWPRILPKGHRTEVNQAGIDYYNNLLDGLEEAGIEPMVTIFHWDTPYVLTYLGDWSNRKIVNDFVDYAELLFQLFGDRVKLWATINEPRSFCQDVPERVHSLHLTDLPLGTYEYLCGHHVLLAHAYTYRLYQDKYKYSQGGKLGIVLNFDENIPYSNSTEDIETAKRANNFDVGWFANPLVFGDYPQIMKDVVTQNSAQQNFTTSRLPSFTTNEKNIVKGSFDVMFLNHYSAHLVAMAEQNLAPSWSNDKQIDSFINTSWPTTNIGFAIHPPALRGVLAYMKETYNNPVLWITENGMSDTGGTSDDARIQFIQSMLEQVRLAMCEDGVKILGYTYWSFLDSFEWNSLYSAKFGLVEVNFTTYDRTLKQSAYYYKNLVQTHLINASSSD